MKTTSFEISKKLAEIGFDKKAGFLDYYYNTDGQLRNKYQEKYCEEENTDVDCFSYDLETILDALPEFIEKDDKRLYFVLRHDIIAYISGKELYVEIEGSFVDSAARLLIKLYEAGLIQFREE